MQRADLRIAYAGSHARLRPVALHSLKFVQHARGRRWFSITWLRLLLGCFLFQQLLNNRVVCQPDGLFGWRAEKFGM